MSDVGESFGLVYVLCFRTEIPADFNREPSKCPDGSRKSPLPGRQKPGLSSSSCVTWDWPLLNFTFLIYNTELIIFFSTYLKFLGGQIR